MRSLNLSVKWLKRSARRVHCEYVVVVVESVPNLIDETVGVAAGRSTSGASNKASGKRMLQSELPQLHAFIKQFQATTPPPPPDVTLTWASPAQALHLHEKSGISSSTPVPPRGVHPHPVIVHQVLSETSSRSVHHIELDIAPQTTYDTAGNCNVHLPNANSVVTRCLKRLSNRPTTTSLVQVLPGHSKTYLPSNEWLSLTSLFTWYVDLSSTPTPRLLRRLSGYATAAPDQTKLAQWATDIPRTLSLVDVLEACPSVALSVEALLSLAPPLVVRSYTIASSPKTNHTSVALTVAAKPPPLDGRCSTHLASTTPFSSTVFASLAPSAFSQHWGAHYPPTVSQLWIGAGTGVAPFRGLIQELALVKNRPKVALYVGYREPSSDELYQCEMQTALATQVLSAYVPVYSNHPPTSHTQDGPWHVGAKLKQDAATVCQYLEHGTVYVCGSLAMGRDVKLALVDCLESHRGWSVDQAKAYVTSLQLNGRYVAEVW
ncbi:hypothetical protein DYB30_006211 [Aphanomyces astaci]|uniref:NADPH--hemoprotein reductase n=1 Tax=Aphanomyces astaci TaxID=112090 RepID=A0A397FEI0_APHAT|nr:hypothetical protein DYB38_005435 [Aphanomyces astaci]RHY59501.1 hypothetical protein DYB34_001162 [Aphanomyces astaci]RHY73700.1 hypothetical protein DYB30_006211 [Aphanomyces astaci]RHZ28479.1 hypothetical protein DYB31_004462 [Aphanomyces astaci]RHZ31190.1 hypothetical protein DYB26_006891 [Aphanomyces astaci]